MNLAAIVVAVFATALAGLRWLRVAQREHYLPGRVSVFAARWWFGSGPNRVLAVAVVLALVAAPVRTPAALVASVAIAAGPFGLAIRGRTGRLAWTRRLRTLAAVWITLQAIVVAAGLAVGETAALAAVGAALVPVLVDFALALVEPVENRLAGRFVAQAAARVKQVSPTVVAITGSYGKTSTKGYVAHFVGPSRTVVASPRSFNNRAGLARAVNEHLVPGTEVFVAEMGTYGIGEIAELCRWLPPRVAAITAIGPVHLERFRTEDNIVTAKSEILDGAEVAVLNVDDERLAALAARRAAAGQRVVRCSARQSDADVAVVADDSGTAVVLAVSGAASKPVSRPVAPLTNVAVAAAIAIELGVAADTVAERIPTLPVTDSRAAVRTGAGGFKIIDDTFNSNPTGAAHALDLLRTTAVEGGRAVLVTPGMVELGHRQADENKRFAAAASEFVTDAVIVGHTNRRALLSGLSQRPVNVVLVETRDDAVNWVKTHLHADDVVLYENDLPDHFP